MFPFLAAKLGLSLIWSKIVFFSVITLIGLCILNFAWYRNRLINQGVAEGFTLGQKALAEKKEAELKVREDQIAAAGVKVAAEVAALALSRKAITQTLYEIKANANAGKATINTQVAAIPGNQLILAIRALSAELGPPAAAIK